MGWFGNRMMRGACNRSNARLAQEFGPNPIAATLALALGHACYPADTYGDKALQDQIIDKLKQFEPRPCGAKDACRHVEDWLDKGTISTDAVFRNVWGLAPQEFLDRFFATLEPENS